MIVISVVFVMNKIYKITGSGVLIFFLAWQFFRYVNYVLNIITPDSFSFDFEPVAVVSFVLLVSVVSLSLVIFKKKRWELVVSGVVGLMFLLFFGFTYINLIGVSIQISLFEYARYDGVKEIDQRTKINSRMILQRSMPAVVMALFVLVSFAAFQSPVAEGIAKAGQLPSASEQLMRSIVESIIGGQIPSGSEKENIITQVTTQTFQQINSLFKSYFKYAPPLLAFGLFLILWGLSWIFVQLSVLVGMGIFWILKKSKFLKIENKDVKAEMLTV